MALPKSPHEFRILALTALTFLADSPHDLARFLALSGMAPGDLRRTAGETGFLGGVLDFFLGEELLLVRFCDAHALDPRAVHIARQGIVARPGGRGRQECE
jgi:hypothetical protein